MIARRLLVALEPGELGSDRLRVSIRRVDPGRPEVDPGRDRGELGPRGLHDEIANWRDAISRSFGRLLSRHAPRLRHPVETWYPRIRGVRPTGTVDGRMAIPGTAFGAVASAGAVWITDRDAEEMFKIGPS